MKKEVLLYNFSYKSYFSDSCYCSYSKYFTIVIIKNKNDNFVMFYCLFI